MNILDLARPFDPAKVSWRVGSTTGDKTRGMALAYVDARDVQDRLNEVCGVENWQCRYIGFGSVMVCEIGIRIGTEWVWKADGAGATDVEAEKGQLSDAFKRAAVKWGVARYLYDLESPWVMLKPTGRSFVIDPSEMPRLARLLGGKAYSPSRPPDGYINATQRDHLLNLIEKSGADLEKFVTHFGIGSVGELSVSRYDEAQRMLMAKMERP